MRPARLKYCRASQKSVIAADTRKEIEDKEQRRANTSKRTAIEGTNSALKRGQGADKLDVRGKIKCRLAMGMNLKNSLNRLQKAPATKGVIVPI